MGFIDGVKRFFSASRQDLGGWNAGDWIALGLGLHGFNEFGQRLEYALDGSTYDNAKSAANNASNVVNDISGSDELSQYIKDLYITNADTSLNAQIFNANQARLARNFSASEAEKSRDWQEMMSNTAYQRGVADMKKAGINPIYAFSQGGASTPVGATAQSSQASVNTVSGDTLSTFLAAISGMLGSSSGLVNSVARLFNRG